MNSSTIMFSNMFSDIYFCKHCKCQSLLQCDRCRATWADSFGADLFSADREKFFGERTDAATSGLAATSIARYGLHAAPVFPRSGSSLASLRWGLFLESFLGSIAASYPAASGIFLRSARFSLSGRLQRAYSASARLSMSALPRAADLRSASFPFPCRVIRNFHWQIDDHGRDERE
ncbi:hypothetical protein [Rhizobium ruizarguesonis]|jgi:hypothetical protein|uniref:hypothetical protein n=1 Tax=Rhizobium ruizarguesonis TaxID=2081791 RepID=UPI001FE22A78|nr:hypothetical protein [Rhizobium ruizarguesonis]